MSARWSGRAACLAFVCVLAVAILQPAGARAQGGCGQVLSGCGICYPGGYDVNTAGSVQGEVRELQVPEEGPVRMTLVDGSERWVVLAAPAWFWETAGLKLAKGDVVTVHGSKTLGADGSLYLIARDIQPPGGGQAIAMRDKVGSPLWRDGGTYGRRRGAVSEGAGSGQGRGRGGARGRR